MLFSRLSLIGCRFPPRSSSSSLLLFQRPFSTQPQKPIALKDALKKFYLLVHPDRLTHRPSERKVNERSFATLQQYLDDYQVTSNVDDDTPLRLAPADPRSVDLTFFLRRDDDLTRIDVALTTPARAANVRPDVKHLELTCRALFKAANLPLEFFVDSTFRSDSDSISSSSNTAASTASPSSRSARRGPQVTSVSELLHKDSVSLAEAAARLSALARHVYAMRELAEREADVVHAAFLHSQAIRVAFSVAGTADGIPLPSHRLELLLRLQSAIRRNTKAHIEELRGVTFVIVSVVNEPIDAWGRVVLGESDSEDGWTAVMRDVDLARVRQKKFDSSSLEALEDRVARCFGVAIVYTDQIDVRAATLQCARLLDEFDALRVAPLVLPTQESLGLQLTCAPDAQFSLVSNLGVFSCPIGAHVPEIRRFVADNAKALANEFVEHTRIVREQERAVTEVRRLFGLRRLTFERHSVTLMQMQRALARLRDRQQFEHGDEFTFDDELAMVYLPNVCMRIVNAPFFSVSVDGYLQIPYDFD